MDTLTAITGRRAINYFDPERRIDPLKLEEIISLANLAPSSFNLQPWEVVIVQSPERKAALRRCASNQAKVEEASAVFIIIANPMAVEENIETVMDNRIRQGYTKPEMRETVKMSPFRQYGEPDSMKRAIFAVKNTSFFAMNCMIAARGLGYETHPMDGFNSDEVKKEFNIPQNRIIPLLLAVGYPIPGRKLLERPARRDIDEFTRIDSFL